VPGLDSFWTLCRRWPCSRLGLAIFGAHVSVMSLSTDILVIVLLSNNVNGVATALSRFWFAAEHLDRNSRIQEGESQRSMYPSRPDRYSRAALEVVTWVGWLWHPDRYPSCQPVLCGRYAGQISPR